MLSSIAIRRKAGIHEFTDAFVCSAPVQEMMARVQTLLDPVIEARGFDRIRSTVEVDLVDGRCLVQDADERYRGGPDHPFTREDLHGKFSDCASLVLAAPVITAVLAMLESLEAVADVGDLVRLMTTVPGAPATFASAPTGAGTATETA